MGLSGGRGGFYALFACNNKRKKGGKDAFRSRGAGYMGALFNGLAYIYGREAVMDGQQVPLPSPPPPKTKGARRWQRSSDQARRRSCSRMLRRLERCRSATLSPPLRSPRELSKALGIFCPNIRPCASAVLHSESWGEER